MNEFLKLFKTVRFAGKLFFSLIGMLFFFLFFAQYHNSHTTAVSNSTEVTGVVTNKYTIVNKTARKGHRKRQYVDVKYTYNGEEQTAEKLYANFWETEGSAIHFCISSDGSAFRTSTTLSPGDLFTFLFVIGLIIILVIGYIKKNGGIPMKKKVPVGIVIDDSDLILEGPDANMDNTFQENTTSESSHDDQPQTSMFEMPASEKQTTDSSVNTESKQDIISTTECETLKSSRNDTSNSETNQTFGLSLRFKDE